MAFVVPIRRLVNQNSEEEKSGQGAKRAESVENGVAFEVEDRQDCQTVKGHRVVHIPCRAERPLLAANRAAFGARRLFSARSARFIALSTRFEIPFVQSIIQARRLPSRRS